MGGELGSVASMAVGGLTFAAAGEACRASGASVPSSGIGFTGSGPTDGMLGGRDEHAAKASASAAEKRGRCMGGRVTKNV